MTDDELTKLIEAAGTGPERWGMSGDRRAWCYRLASKCGALVGELRALRVRDFTFGKEPSVTLQASYARKRGETHVMPLSKATGAGLRKLLKGEPADAVVFDLPERSVVMLREDLEAAGVPYEDAQGRFADFYALRHTAGTRFGYVAESFADLQALLRHKTPKCTTRYIHAREDRMRAAMERL